MVSQSNFQVASNFLLHGIQEDIKFLMVPDNFVG